MHTICATYAKIAAAFHGHGQQSWSTWLAGWLDFAIVFNRQRRQRPNEACNSPRTSATSNFKLMARKLRQALWAKVSKKPRQREQPLVGYSSYIAPDPASQIPQPRSTHLWNATRRQNCSMLHFILVPRKLNCVSHRRRMKLVMPHEPVCVYVCGAF